MLTVEKLKAFGADVDEGLTRCLNNEDFYLRLVAKALADGNFDGLKKAVDAGDFGAAFEAAHALKGVLGNLSITPLYDMASNITELLRANESADYQALTGELLKKREQLTELCK